MNLFLTDLRFAFRVFRLKPVFYGAAVLTLALGIGATTAIFSVVNAVLLKPLPFPEGKELVRLSEVSLRQGAMPQPVAMPNFEDWKSQSKTMSSMAAYECSSFTVTGQSMPERVIGCGVTEDFFSTLRVNALHGTVFSSANPGAVAVISNTLWERDYGGREELIGQTIRLNLKPVTLAGVMPPGFRVGAIDADIWVPMEKDATASNRGMRYLSAIARLRQGVSVSQARAEFKTIAERLRMQYPDTNQDTGVLLTPLQEFTVANLRPALLVLFGAIGCLLLVACINVANMLLARAVSRSGEMGIRTAMGAPPSRIFRQLITESVLLACSGGALGCLVAWGGLKALPWLVPAEFRPASPITMDGWVLLFSGSVSVVTGVVFGIAPVLELRRLDLIRTLVENGRTVSSGRFGRQFRNALVIAEVAISLTLLIAASALTRSFVKLKSVDPGFNTQSVMTFRMALPTAQYQDGAHQAAFFTQVLQQLAAVPGVSHAAAADYLPFGGARSSVTFAIAGPGFNSNDYVQADQQAVSQDYFRTMAIPLLRGREFAPQDREKAPLVAVINEAAARRYWGVRDPLGSMLTFDGKERFEVVGVVGNTKQDGLDTDWVPQVYTAYAQTPASAMSMVVKGNLSANQARSLVMSIDPDQPIYRVKPLQEMVDDSVGSNRFVTYILGIFAAITLLLACTGVYAIVSYATAQRTSEIGIRLALGASRRDVFVLIERQVAKLGIAGILAGIAGAMLSTNLLTSYLYNQPKVDPITYTVAIAVIAAALLAASLLPAMRAARLNPLVALRQP